MFYSIVKTPILALALLLLSGASALGHGDLDEGIADLTRQIENDPESARLLVKRAELYRLQQDWQSAAGDLDRAAELNPGLATPEFLLDRAQLHAAADGGCSPNAINGLDASINRFGPTVMLISHAIDLELACSQWQGALKQFDRLPAVVKAYPKWMVRRAEIFREGGQIEAARSSLIEARQRLESLSPERRALSANVELAAKIDEALRQSREGHRAAFPQT